MKKNNRKYYVYIIIVIILVLLIILIYNSGMNKKSSKDSQTINNNSNIENKQKNLIVKLEWRDPGKISPYSGRYELCPDGLNKGNIWMDLTINNIAPDVYLICKDEVTPFGDPRPIDFIQWNIGLERHKAGLGASGRELKKKHIVKVCCNSNDKTINLCEEFTLDAYC